MTDWATGFVVSRLHHQHPSEKVICDAVRADPHNVTLLCLGPLTNIARAFQRDPELPVLVDRLVISGGCVDGIGNVTAAAEYNMFFDANHARTVFRSPVTKTLVPLDVTRTVKWNLDLYDKLPADTTQVGFLPAKILPFLYRAFHQRLGQEGILLHDVVALAAVLEPTMFEYAEMSGDVETRGELTLGTTVFDRRYNPQWRPNMDVALRRIPRKSSAVLSTRWPPPARRRGRTAGLFSAWSASPGFEFHGFAVPKTTSTTSLLSGVSFTWLIRWSSSSIRTPSNDRMMSPTWMPRVRRPCRG